MVKNLAWVAIACLLLWLCWRFVSWPTVLQVVLLGVTCVWVLVGLWMLSRQWRARAAVAHAQTERKVAVGAERLRAEHIARYGAVETETLERAQPGYFERLSRVIVGSK